MAETKTIKKDKTDTKQNKLYSLILWNDPVNTFDDIIDALIEICAHDPHQAEQCTTIAHHKGKCIIKSGEPLEILKGYKRLFDQRKIFTSME